jgi:hypothetical protein
MMYMAHDLFDGGLIIPKNSISHLSKYFNVTCGTTGISSLLQGFPILWKISLESYKIPWNPYEGYATIIMSAKSYELFIFLHSFLLKTLHEPHVISYFLHDLIHIVA